MNKKFYIAVIAVVIVVGGYFAFNDSDYPIKKPTAGQNIIVFGDSLVEGAGATQENDFVSVLSRNLNQPVINAGFSGDTTVTAMTRVDEDVLSRDPRVVVILLGGNDFIQRIAKERTISNLRQMIMQIQERGAGVVLVGVRKIIYSPEYEDLAQETGSVYVPNILDETFGDRTLMSDQIHPNDAGYRIFAEKITPAVQQLLE